MKYREACAQKFALHLYNNKYLSDDLTISKPEATKIFSKFKKEHKLKINFWTLLNMSHGLVKFIRGGLLKYHQKQMTKIKGNEGQIDVAFQSNKEQTVLEQNSSVGTIRNGKNEDHTELFCKFCKVKCDDETHWKRHVSEENHLFLRDLNKTCRNGRYHPNLRFSIDGSTNLSNLIVRKNTPKTFHVKIQNFSRVSVKITSIRTDANIPQVKFEPSVPCTVDSEEPTVVWELTVHCKTERVLSFPVLISTRMPNSRAAKKYMINFVFHAHDEFFDDLHPIGPFKKNPPKGRLVLEDTLGPAFVEKETDTRLPLKQYRIPRHLFMLLNCNLQPSGQISKGQEEQLDHIRSLALENDKRKSLTVAHNYTSLLKVLLHAEEHQLLKTVKTYDTQQLFKRVGGLLELEVPDLAERRPSVLVSDVVQVRVSGDIYNGIITRVKETSIMIRFPRNFMRDFNEGRKYSISFTFNRYCIRTQHQAIDLTEADNIGHIFFPEQLGNPPDDLNIEDLEWSNKDIANNPEQQQAVRAVLKKSAMPAPYLIFGPPGTGKTMTVVECVKQVYRRTDERVLICAPSNSAGNEITRRLIDTIPKGALFRYVAASFSDFMPEDLMEYSNFDHYCHYQPKMSEIAEYRIVITTLVSAARLINLKCPKNHFSYVFIDEAGQATESETMIPIARILSNQENTGCISGQIVLAGDPRQLGPVIQSAAAKQYGYDISTLERLMDTCDLYSKNNRAEYNPFALTKLLRNYRSHPVIFNIPNRLFYDDELQAAGDDQINAALDWSGLPNRAFPMIFHSVIGADQREKDSPSYFNVQEIKVITEYLDQLINSRMGGLTINASHIMIVSPYKKQVNKIRQACEKKKYGDLLIGSVEQVQGQERLIVLVSTVRSTPQLTQFDEKFHLGFLNNPKRFNVAITRAKALLIVVGNPNLLQFDTNWKALIEYCKNNGAIAGDSFDFGGDETLSDAQNMSLLDETAREQSASFTEAI